MAGFNIWSGLAAMVFSTETWAQKLVEKAIELEELEGKMGEIRTMIGKIIATLKDADEHRCIERDAVKLWLRNLYDLGLDSEDLLELWDTRKTMQETNRAAPTNWRRSWRVLMSSSVYGCSFSVPQPLFMWLVAKEVAAINNRFALVSKQRKLHLPAARVPADRVRPPTGPLQHDTFIGMIGDTQNIVCLLVPKDPHPSPPKMELVAIKGMGGSGKTAVAKSAYNHKTVVKFFEKKIWVEVKKNHGAESIISEMLESLGESTRFCNFATSQQRLKQLVEGKKLLLVLDNTDDGFQHYWGPIRAALVGAAPESKVMVTTRSENVAKEMGADSTYQLEGLLEEEWLDLFKSKVRSNLNDDPRLQDIAKKIAVRCERSPLVAKYLGSLMSYRINVEDWTSILGDPIRGAQEGGDTQIMEMLLRSYEFLSLKLKRCFAFCALFPNDHTMKRDELAKIWAALGIFDGDAFPELSARWCFDQLQLKSFFEQTNHPESGASSDENDCLYKMPKLMHDLARLACAGECGIIRGRGDREDTPRTPQQDGRDVRHLIRDCSGLDAVTDMQDFTKQADHLRTFIMLNCFGLSSLPENLFLKMPCLRVLDLSCTTICKLPDSIGELKLLRYLNLSRTLLAALPDSVTSLLKLESLNLADCYFLHQLPQHTSNLTRLRHLSLRLSHHKRSHLTSMPPEMGKLTALTSLPRFVVGKKSMTCGIDQLRDMTNLYGELCLSKLENVEESEHARMADLKSKTGIQSLTLQWTTRPEEWPQIINDNNGSSNNALETIDHLRPHASLRTLTIDNYYGRRSPTWLSDLKYLVSVRLSHSPFSACLATLGRLMKLKHLDMEGISNITAVMPNNSTNDLFRSLNTLNLRDMTNLKTWNVFPNQMRNLKKLCFLCCPQLDTISNFPPALVELHIKGCNSLMRGSLPQYPPTLRVKPDFPPTMEITSRQGRGSKRSRNGKVVDRVVRSRRTRYR